LGSYPRMKVQVELPAVSDLATKGTER